MTGEELIEQGWSDRWKVLRTCIELESYSSSFLTTIFKLPEETISFGRTGKALTFENKLNLMLDIASISKDDRKRFTLLQEMRNQFAHNLNAINFEFYYVITGTKPEHNLFKWYPPDGTGSHKERLNESVDLWLKDLKRIHFKAERMIGSRLNKNIRDKVNAAVLEVYRRGREKLFDSFEDRKSYTGKDVNDMIQKLFRDIDIEQRKAMDDAIHAVLRGRNDDE